MKRAMSASLFSLFAFLSLAATQQSAHAATCSFEALDINPHAPGYCWETAEVKFGSGSSLSQVVFHCDGPQGVVTQTVIKTVAGPGDIFVPADGVLVEFNDLPAGNYNAWALACITAPDGGNGNASTGDNYFTVSTPY